MADALAERRALKDRVLGAALLHAAFDGWTRRTLVNAAADAGLDPLAARRLFPRGGDSLLAWLDDWADRQMLERAGDLQRLSVRRRITALVRARLEALEPHREALRRAALARGLPANMLGTGQTLWRTVDRMWQAAGVDSDQRPDFSFYSRRLTLGGVLVATFLYWLEDRSELSRDSWAFLDRRIEDVMRIGRARAALGTLASRLPFGRPGSSSVTG
jgi:ubiquinone biosynthesis protein COQ9